MSAAVTGASGMLGREVVRMLRQAQVVTDELERTAFDVPTGTRLVVHCGAMTDAAECAEHPDDAHLANAVWPGRLAAAAHKTGARFVHISTVAVYDLRQEAAHSEDEKPLPRGEYARSKLEGERRVLEACPEATVVRPMIFGRTLPARRAKLAEKILKALSAKEKMVLWENLWFCPVYTEDLARLIMRLWPADMPGVLNVGSSDGVSQLEFGRLLALGFGFDPAMLTGEHLSRSENMRVDLSRARTALGKLPSATDGVMHFREAEGAYDRAVR